MDLSISGEDLRFQLQYRPYHPVEKRNRITQYNNSRLTAVGWFLGLVETGAWIAAIATLPGKDDNVEFSKDTESMIKISVEKFLKKPFTLSAWKAAKPWQIATFWGVVADAGLSSMLHIPTTEEQEQMKNGSYNRTVKETGYTSWKATGESKQGLSQSIPNHPYQLKLPTFDFSKDYQTKTGENRIPLYQFTADLPKPSQNLGFESIQFQAFTHFEGKNYDQTFRLIEPQLTQHFRNLTGGINMLSIGTPQLMPRPEAAARWMGGDLTAGETARLNITVKNSGKGELYRFVANTDSRVTTFDSQRLEFGQIDPGQSKSLEISFQTDPLMRTQDIPVEISFDEYNSYVPPAINAKLYVAEALRPKFDYAYQIVDGGTENSVGNGDGIIQYGESFDLALTVRNSGTGAASQVQTKLTLLQKVSRRSSSNRGVNIFGDSTYQMTNIQPGSSQTATFNIGVKPNALVSSIPLYLTITDQQYPDTRLVEEFVIPVDKKVAPKIVVVDLMGQVVPDSAEVHSGAGVSTSIIAQVPKRSRLKISGQLGDWYRVESGDLTGWVRTSQITTQEMTAPTTSTVSRPSETKIIKVFQQMPPTLTLVAPEVTGSISVNTGTIQIIAVATDDKGIQRVDLTVNGEKVETRGLKRVKRIEKTITIKESVPLQYGNNQIKLVAYDTQKQTSTPITVSVQRTREMSELWVLAMGVSDYQHVTKLKYADDDAQAIADYFRGIGVPEDHITLLTDHEVTASNVRSKLGQLMSKAGKSATVLIYFSGHGAPAPSQSSLDGDGIDKYLLTREADPSNFYGTALPMDEVAGIFQRLRSDRVIFMADTCYSGAAGGKTALAKGMIGKKAAPDYNRFLSRLAEGKGRVILTASQGNELSQEKQAFGHGVFTYYVLQALEGQGKADTNGDGFITIREIYNYVSREVPKSADQNPAWRGEESGDIVIGRVR